MTDNILDLMYDVIFLPVLGSQIYLEGSGPFKREPEPVKTPKNGSQELVAGTQGAGSLAFLERFGVGAVKRNL